MQAKMGVGLLGLCMLSLTPVHGCVPPWFWFSYLCLIFIDLFRKFYKAVSNQISKGPEENCTQNASFTSHIQWSAIYDLLLNHRDSENFCFDTWFVWQRLFCWPLGLPARPVFPDSHRGGLGWLEWGVSHLLWAGKRWGVCLVLTCVNFKPIISAVLETESSVSFCLELTALCRLDGGGTRRWWGYIKLDYDSESMLR